MTTVWLSEPRSHGRKMEGARARNEAPLPGRHPSFRVPHRSASSALCPCGHAASFRRRASSFVRGVWCLGFGGAASGGDAMRARAVCAACRAACSRAVLPCGCGCCCGGVCAATLAALGARAVEGARVAAAWCARWVSWGGEAGFLSWLRAGGCVAVWEEVRRKCGTTAEAVGNHCGSSSEPSVFCSMTFSTISTISSSIALFRLFRVRELAGRSSSASLIRFVLRGANGRHFQELP